MRHTKATAPTPRPKPSAKPKPRGEQAITHAAWERIQKAIRALGAAAARPA